MAAIFRRGTTWWVTYRVDNKRLRKSLETDNERVARDRLKYLDGLNKIGELPGPSQVGVSEFLQSYCRHLLASGRPKGARTDISRLRNFFGPCCPAMHYAGQTPKSFRKAATGLPVLALENGNQRVSMRYLEQITTLSIKTFIDDNLADENFGHATANKYLENLTRMFNYAFDVVGYRCPVRGLKHPVMKLKRYRVAAPVISYLDHRQIEEQLAAVASDVVVHAMVAVYIFAGLRREEVAELAGVSVAYYTRLEQGHGHDASDSVLDALARVLHLDDDERTHLATLAGTQAVAAATQRPEWLLPQLRALIESFANVPALVLGRRSDILAWNRPAHALLACHRTRLLLCRRTRPSDRNDGPGALRTARKSAGERLQPERRSMTQPRRSSLVRCPIGSPDRVMSAPQAPCQDQ